MLGGRVRGGPNPLAKVSLHLGHVATNRRVDLDTGLVKLRLDGLTERRRDRSDHVPSSADESQILRIDKLKLELNTQGRMCAR
ncbi:MAG: hypothetical protein NVSMB9_12160 [Isosphaeraceae bacterium]